jgi:hypothetical protein
VNEESAILGFQDVSDDDAVELLESVSLPLMNEELDSWTCKHIKKHRMAMMMRL